MTSERRNLKLELTWVGKDARRPLLEPRILLEDAELSVIADRRRSEKDIFNNILIEGDNLLALKALQSEYAGKVKLIYIDPPYNTGYAFENYDDGMEHSLWLDLMRARLEELRKLLKDDGIIVAQIGYDEMAYLKVLMDEIFGRNNCIGQVAVRMSHSAGMKRIAKDKRLIKNTEYLLFYYKDLQPTLSPVYEETKEFPVNYYQWIEDFPTEESTGKYTALSEILFEEFKHFFAKYNFSKSNKSISMLFEIEEDVRNFIVENRDRIARKHTEVPTTMKDYSYLAPDEFERYDVENRFYFMGFSESRSLYQIIPLTEKVQRIESFTDEGIEGKNVIANLLGDWWDGFWRDMSRVDVEGAVLMKESKKPERLIQRIINLCTKKGDLILDSFLGSGTTAAVAHKMSRQWIGIEMGRHAQTLAHTRLKRVVDGKDQTGITEAERWRGGGGFRYFRLAPSLLRQDRWGQYVINPQYNAEMLAEACCKIQGYTYAPSQNQDYYWMHGRSTERDFIYVTTNYLTHAQLVEIAEEVGTERSLLILTTAYDSAGETLENLTLKKIPRALLDRCDWDHDDYSLNVANLPQAQPAPEPEPVGAGRRGRGAQAGPGLFDLPDGEGA